MTGHKQVYNLAPMAPSILILTLVLWLLPISFLIYGLAWGRNPAVYIAIFLLVLYGSVWLSCRPSRFIIDNDRMRIVFPAWQRYVLLGGVTAVRSLTGDEFKKDYGFAMRIGVGGLWGGFGWLWTSKGGYVEFYVSRFDGLVLLERKDGKNILITPENPQGFIADMNNTIFENTKV